MNPLEQQFELESLRTSLEEAKFLLSKKESEMVQLRTDFETKLRIASSRLNSLQEQYDLLLADYHRLVKLNHELEDRLLSTLETVTLETTMLSKELESTTHQLKNCENELSAVVAERDRLKEDCSTAVSLLQANPSHFVPASKVRNNAHSSSYDALSHHQPLSLSPAFLPTFPPVGLSSAFHVDSHRDQNRTDWFQPNKSNPSSR
ncbi:unnamed protein product [Dicrocoelium dendriticum]|nr:unnamed protein product [Dicrocoelium dendriticum]